MMKKPWLAAVLNFFFFGVGYIYVGRRVLFGILLIIVGIVDGIFWLSTGSMPPQFIATTFVISGAFAYDGYRDAEERNKLGSRGDVV